MHDIFMMFYLQLMNLQYLMSRIGILVVPNFLASWFFFNQVHSQNMCVAADLPSVWQR